MDKNKKTYWPHMIVGFLIMGFTLSYWTVKSASSIPVQESNRYMMKYQDAELNINEIMQRQELFNSLYTIELTDSTVKMLELENVKRVKSEKVVLLTKGNNRFAYRILNKNRKVVDDANVSFLLTRPHTRSEDMLIDSVKMSDGKYVINDIVITKPGRYTLQVKAKIGKAIAFMETPAYLEL